MIASIVSPDFLRRASVRIATKLTLLLLLTGCASEHYVINAPLLQNAAQNTAQNAASNATPNKITNVVPPYSARFLEANDNSNSLLIAVAFSGGGYRAAALAYSVMREMENTKIVWEGKQKSVLDEVDFVSSVSGGSLTAAYYALYGKELFTTFEKNVLEIDLQSAMLTRTLSPRGLWRQTSSTFGRGDLLQELFDDKIFHGATYAAIPRKKPMVFITATDLEFGDRFEFSQEQFDHLCSDLNSVPISRAVAASAAVPIVFSPITIWNHNKNCPSLLKRLATSSRASKSTYIHLVDGGLSDNSGILTPLELIAARGGVIKSAQAIGVKGIKKRVFVIVNSQVRPQYDEDGSPNTPGLLRQLQSAIDTPIDRYAAANVMLLKREIARWKDEIARASDDELAGTLDRNVEFYVIEISFQDASTKLDTAVLQNIPTAFRISPDDVSRIDVFARESLRINPEWQRLLRDLTEGR